MKITKIREVKTPTRGTECSAGHLIYSLMAEKKELGHYIYAVACHYAHNYIAAEERDKINAVISAVAEVHKKPKGSER